MVDADSSLLLTLLRELRAEIRDLRPATLGIIDGMRRLERRMSDLRDELELMLKAEALGRATHFETLYGEKLSKLEDRLATI